ncbi:MAG: DUF896 domain-containing protein [Selenomonadaceae bacterium]
MITTELIQSINALAKKKRTVGLTPDELTEQTKLRQIYLETIHNRLEHSLKNIEIVDNAKQAVTIIREEKKPDMSTKSSSANSH